jgi:hypothetical protein
MGVGRGPLSLVSATEALLQRRSSGSGLEILEYGRRHPLYWPRDTLSPQELTLTWPTSASRSVDIIHSRTEATEFSFIVNNINNVMRNYYAESYKYVHRLEF